MKEESSKDTFRLILVSKVLWYQKLPNGQSMKIYLDLQTLFLCN